MLQSVGALSELILQKIFESCRNCGYCGYIHYVDTYIQYINRDSGFFSFRELFYWNQRQSILKSENPETTNALRCILDKKLKSSETSKGHKNIEVEG